MHRAHRGRGERAAVRPGFRALALPVAALWLALAGAALFGCSSKQPTPEALAQSGPPTLEDVGRRVYDRLRCGACHSLDGRVLAAPTLKGLYGKPVMLSNGTSVVADEAYIRRSILEPRRDLVRGYAPSMASYQGQITRSELAALVAMIRSLGDATGGSVETD